MLVFIFVPSFYAAVEQVDDPSLRGRPVIVGGDPRKRGRVTSSSGEARALGVSDGMPVSEALALCAGASLRPTRLPRYREAAAEIRAILRTSSPRLENVGLDGTYLEGPDDPDLLETAAGLCVTIRAETGITSHAGIGATRFVAWLAGRHAGPEAIRHITEAGAREFLSAFPVTELWGLGPATARKLSAEGVGSIAEFRDLSPERLRAIVGRGAERMLELACGEDREALQPSPHARSFSQEQTLADPTQDLSALGAVLFELAERIDRILVREQRTARTVTVGVGFVDAEQQSRTRTLRDPISGEFMIREVALDLLRLTQAPMRPVRRLRLQIANLSGARPAGDPRQLRLL